MSIVSERWNGLICRTKIPSNWLNHTETKTLQRRYWIEQGKKRKCTFCIFMMWLCALFITCSPKKMKATKIETNANACVAPLRHDLFIWLLSFWCLHHGVLLARTKPSIEITTLLFQLPTSVARHQKPFRVSQNLNWCFFAWSFRMCLVPDVGWLTWKNYHLSWIACGNT